MRFLTCFITAAVTKINQYFNPSFAPLPPSTVEECLEKADLMKYNSTFEEDEIGMDVLEQVTPDDLVELGLTKGQPKINLSFQNHKN